MLTTSIKHHTADAHASLEKVIVGHLKAMQSKEAYLSILHYFYRFIVPVEQRIASYLGDSFPQYARRDSKLRLEKDLQLLAPAKKELPGLPVTVNWINHPLDAAGALYVLEGSSLGAMVISKMIADKLQITKEDGIHYFSGYGAETMERWSVFKNWLNTIAATPQEEQQVLAAAGTTFNHFKQSILTHVE